MTETDWLYSVDSRKMLEFLHNKVGRPLLNQYLTRQQLERKIRLFLVACARRVWHQFSDERSKTAIEVVERYADGLATRDELEKAHSAAVDANREACLTHAANGWAKTHIAYVAADLAVEASYVTFLRLGFTSCLNGASDAVSATAQHWNAPHFDREVPGGPGDRSELTEEVVEQLQRQESAVQADSLRDIFGNPFHSAAISPSWLAWIEGAAAKLTQAIYDARRFDDLPILADALEEAGCTDPTVLAHCREPGLHIRGCWVLDLVRSRKRGKQVEKVRKST